MSDKYILNGHEAVPVDDLYEWGAWFQTANRHIAQDEPLPGVRVSTVFLGLDHRYGGDGPPLIFESMVFGGELDQEMDRYSTWEEAERGHAAMIERVKASAGRTAGAS